MDGADDEFQAYPVEPMPRQRHLRPERGRDGEEGSGEERQGWWRWGRRRGGGEEGAEDCNSKRFTRKTMGYTTKRYMEEKKT